MKVDRSGVDKIGKIEFGVCQIIDGLVRVLSLGYLCTDLPIRSAKRTAYRYFNKSN